MGLMIGVGLRIGSGILVSGVSPSFTPLSLSPYWWVAPRLHYSAASGGLTSGLNDQSNNSRNFVQATAGNQPGIITDGGMLALQIQASRANFLALASNSGLPTSAGCELWVVRRLVTDRQLVSHFSTTDHTIGVVSTFYDGLYYESALTTVRKDGLTMPSNRFAKHIWRVRAGSTGAWQAWQNNNSVHSVASGNVVAWNANPSIGSVLGGFTGVALEYESLLVPPLTTQQATDLTTYLSGIHGL